MKSDEKRREAIAAAIDALENCLEIVLEMRLMVTTKDAIDRRVEAARTEANGEAIDWLKEDNAWRVRTLATVRDGLRFLLNCAIRELKEVM